MVEQALERMTSEVKGCIKCTLHEGRQNAVFGMGNPYAEIMLIGDSPSLEEDEQGLPFVGKSGHLLDKILLACGFNREEHVYIANIVKCRPPENRGPHQEEREACLPWLYEQIVRIQPKIIILLGATALQGLIDPEAQITKIRGKWLDWEGYHVMPTFHPSALLQHPELKKDAWNDFKQVVELYQKIINPLHELPSPAKK